MTCPHCGYDPTESQKGKQVFCCRRSMGNDSEPKPVVWPLLIRGIARQRIESDIGVGDTVHRILSHMGGNQFEWAMERLGIDCGCKSGREWLNRAYPYE